MESLHKWFGRVLMTGVAAIGLSSCASGGYYARAPIPPPPPGAYVRGVAPGAGYVYRDGYYNWNRGRYAWVAPGWVRPPRPTAVWVSPNWRGNRWVRGRWRY